MKKMLYIFVIASLIFAIYSIITYSIPTVEMSELEKFIGKDVQVQGTVVKGSLRIFENNNTIVFSITDGKNVVRVYYNLEKLYIPSETEELIAIVRGKVIDKETILAKKVLISCPSKYEIKVEQ